MSKKPAKIQSTKVKDPTLVQQQQQYSNHPFPSNQVPYNPVMSPQNAFQYRRDSVQSQDQYHNQYNNFITPQQQLLMSPPAQQHNIMSPPYSQQQHFMMSPPRQQQLLSPVKTPLSSTSPLSYKSNTAPLQLYLPQTAAAAGSEAHG